MKKLLALVLAVAMLCTVAFAAYVKDPAAKDEGKPVVIEPKNWDEINKPTLKQIAAIAGKTEAQMTTDGWSSSQTWSSKYYTVKITYEKGKELVKSTGWRDADEYFVFTWNTNYAKTLSTNPDFQLKKVEITQKKDGSTVSQCKVSTDTKEGLAATLDWLFTASKTKAVDNLTSVQGGKAWIGYPTILLAFDGSDDDYSFVNSQVSGMLVKISNLTANEYNAVVGGTSRTSAFNTYAGGEIELTSYEDLVTVKFKAWKDDVLNLKSDGGASATNKSILQANDDIEEHEIRFLRFNGSPSITSGKVIFDDLDDDGYVYEIKDGKLVETTAKYDDSEGSIVLKTNKLGYYVLSDKELHVATVEPEAEGEPTEGDETSGTSGTSNPDTGANDVVAIATALAVVSLVAAGAVSLKKN